MEELYNELMDLIQDTKNEIIKNQMYERAARLRDLELLAMQVRPNATLNTIKLMTNLVKETLENE